MIVLHESRIEPRLRLKYALVIAFEEKAARVFEDPGLEHQHFAQRGLDYLHERGRAKSVGNGQPGLDAGDAGKIHLTSGIVSYRRIRSKPVSGTDLPLATRRPRWRDCVPGGRANAPDARCSKRGTFAGSPLPAKRSSVRVPRADEIPVVLGRVSTHAGSVQAYTRPPASL